MKAKLKKLPRIPIKELANEVSKLLKEKELKVKNNFYISLAVALSQYQIPARMYHYFASAIGKELGKRKRINKKEGTP